MATKLNLGIEYFNDPETGRPLASGQVYIGQVDLDPAIEANRVTVTLEQEDGSNVSIAPSAQPLTIGAGGRIMYSGSPVAVTVDGAYSIKVLDNLGSQIYYVAASNQPEADPDDTGLLVLNDSFENQEVTTGLPDNWTLNIGENGSIEVDSSDQAHGLNSLKFTGTDATGGGTATSSLFDVLKGGSLCVEFTYKSSAADTLNKVQVKYYNEVSAVVSTDTVYSNGATNPVSYTTYVRRSSVPLTAVQAVIILTGIDGAGTTVIGATNFDRIYAGKNSLNEYNNIEDLRGSNPADGKIVYSKGHTDIDDGGGGTFLGVTGASPGTYVDDNGITIVPTGGDGSAAWLRQFSGDKVYPKWFGAVYDGTTDDTAAHQAAIDSGYNVEPHQGSTVISETLIVPARQSFYGHGWNTVIIPATSGTWVSNFVILYNSTDASTWTVSTPGMPAGKIGGFRINNNSGDATTKGVFAAGSVNLKNIRGQGLAQILRTSSDYNDMVVIDRPYATNPVGSLYQVEISNLGDGLRVQNYFCDDVTWPGTNALKITGCRGGVISSSIGGNYYFDNCEALEFTGFHIETGVVTANESRITISDGEIFENSLPRITLSATSGNHHVTLDKVLFIRDIDTDAADFNDLDVVVSNRNTVSIRDCYTRTLKPSNLTITELGGILVGSDSSTPLTEFNDYSYIYSRYCEIYRNNKIKPVTAVFDSIAEGAFAPFSGLAATGNVTWKKATDTYYYNMAYIYDWDRNVGRADSAGERSLALTLAGSGALLTVGGARLQNALLVVYRGTTTNSYDEYAIIPITSTSLLYDNGETINGYKWKSRTAAAVPTLTDSLSGELIGGNIVMRRDSTSAPTQGTWVTGDQILDSNPSASGFMGVVCVSGGTPGTWKTFGTISA